MKLAGKLISVFAVAMAGVGALSVSTHLAMDRNIHLAESIRNQKLNSVLFVERISASAQRLIVGINASVNSALEDGLDQAGRARGTILELLEKQGEAVIGPEQASLGQAVDALYACGQSLVTAVIDQEFSHVTETSRTYKVLSEDLKHRIDVLTASAQADLQQSLGQMVTTSSRGARISFWISCVLMALMVCLLLFLLSSVIRPIRRVVESLKDVAQGQGDITKRLAVHGTNEVGELAHWFNIFSEKLHNLVRAIAGDTETLRFSAGMLFGLSGDMNMDVISVAENAGAVKTDGDNINSNINSVASAMEQTSANIGLIASSAEEMSNTIGEIAGNTEKARTIAALAADQAGSASEHMSRLGDAVQKIGQIALTIKEISDQTNLLALNATIEAARAGDSGKGFAVVANEIKELSLQTANATGSIGAQIQDIQKTARESVEKVATISTVIQDVTDIVATIAASIEEQSVVTREIAGNVAHASEGVAEMNAAMANSAKGVDAISGQLTDIHQATDEMAHRCSQAKLGADDLRGIAAKIDAQMEQFKLRPPRFNIGEVKGAHLNWRYRLYAVVNGYTTLNDEELSSHKGCDFGKWLYSTEGEALAAHSGYEDVCREHEKVHTIASEVISAVNTGNKGRVASLMENFENARQCFFTALETLYH